MTAEAVAPDFAVWYSPSMPPNATATPPTPTPTLPRQRTATKRRRSVWRPGVPAPAWYRYALATFREGERALWFSVLDNAIQALRGKLRVNGRRPSRAFLAREARAWIAREEQEPLGTFASICRELDLDRATVRADLLAIEYVGQTTRPEHLRLVVPEGTAA